MTKADELRAEYEAALKSLQDACQHVWSEPLPYMWAPGHYGAPVRFCEHCNLMKQ